MTTRLIAVLTLLALATAPVASAAFEEAPDAPDCPGSGGNVGTACEGAVAAAWAVVIAAWPIIGDALDRALGAVEFVEGTVRGSCSEQLGDDCIL